MNLVLVLFFLISSVFAEIPASPLSKEEEARKAAEVLGSTYRPSENKVPETVINFHDEINDEEKDVILGNYERTKNQYKEDNGDTLFERISKAYVRNLDRILVRKNR